MRPSPCCDRVVGVMEEPVHFTLLTRDRSEDLTTRYSERKEAAEREARHPAAQTMSHEVNAAAEWFDGGRVGTHRVHFGTRPDRSGPTLCGDPGGHRNERRGRSAAPEAIGS